MSMSSYARNGIWRNSAMANRALLTGRLPCMMVAVDLCVGPGTMDTVVSSHSFASVLTT